MPLVPIKLDEKLIGKYLPWDLYTENGILVARSGIKVRDVLQFTELSSRPLFLRKLDLVDMHATHAEPNADLHALIRNLPATLAAIHSADFEIAVRNAARRLIRLSQRNHDALLGLTRLARIDDLAVRHCLLVAILAIGLGKELEMSHSQIESLACAALTMNLSALRVHSDLAGGEKPYNHTARFIIQHHPERSASLLAALEIKDADWLTAVRQHHENMDGSGYPKGLHGPDISQLARILRVGDYFIAKITGRRHRPPKSAQFALRLILVEGEREQLDTEMAKLLLQRHGLYPPGTVVKLENQEVAVITRNSGRCGATSSATSFMLQRGSFLAFPVVRHISEPGHGVVEVLERDAYQARFPWEDFWRDWE